MTPQDNETSKALVKQADAKQAELKKLEGAAFDKAYADNEVAYHKAVDNALETVLIPNASNAELKDLLVSCSYVPRSLKLTGEVRLDDGKFGAF